MTDEPTQDLRQLGGEALPLRVVESPRPDGSIEAALEATHMGLALAEQNVHDLLDGVGGPRAARTQPGRFERHRGHRAPLAADVVSAEP